MTKPDNHITPENTLFTEYKNRDEHQELVEGRIYCVKDITNAEDFEYFAKFTVYEDGEVAFIDPKELREVRFTHFRQLDRKLDDWRFTNEKG